MNVISNQPKNSIALTILLLAAPVSVAAQQEVRPVPVSDGSINVYGSPPADLSELAEGPDLEGFIAARKGSTLRVMTEEGAATDVRISEGTEIKARKGLFGIGRKTLGENALLNGLPVSVKTVEWNGGLIAEQVRFRDNDLKTASMIRTGTSQGFAEQTAATEALRGRVGDIDQYNIKGTTNVYFDTGKYALSSEARSNLCMAANQAGSTDNALLLVVGYTDSTGTYEINQQLSEKRASRVVNYLQQQCGWKPYRMLTPTGMAEADPAADNTTASGKAQNRRVAVNILVSKSVDGL
ncbi:MAG: OmpA family protein [Erythrobacter sp.]